MRVQSVLLVRVFWPSLSPPRQLHRRLTRFNFTPTTPPPDLITGKIYPAKAFARKAGTNGATDPGLFYSFNIFVDDSSLTLDPKSGVITWKVSTTVTGAITYPSGS
jgi:hypothetical protein